MPSGDTLTPIETARIATNSYFTLKNWIDGEPTAGVESKSNIQNRVLGQGNAGSGGHANTSLKGTQLGKAKIKDVFSATTGFGVSSGFGYTLSYKGNGKTHTIIATRGTRPELPGLPDIITDIHAAGAPFGQYGLVHKGFKNTFDSILPSLIRDKDGLAKSDVVHCVGHSLGGAVATLIAAHLAGNGANVKLYTFGCPRVGCFNAYAAMTREIGANNIYRVAHDLDPVSLIAPFPYIHIHPKAGDRNNMTLVSPSGKLLSTANHDMTEYIRSIQMAGDWQGVRNLKQRVNLEDSLLVRWLLHEGNNPGWVSYASAYTLSLLFKLFSHVLKGLSTALILGLTAVDFLAEILVSGLHRMRQLGGAILKLLRYAAEWAGIKVAKTADFTFGIIHSLLSKMLSTLKNLATKSIQMVTKNILPVTIGMGGAWALSSANSL